MSDEAFDLTLEPAATQVDKAPKAVKEKKLSDKDRIEKLEKNLKAVVDMLNKMSSAIGLPKSIMPDLD